MDKQRRHFLRKVALGAAAFSSGSVLPGCGGGASVAGLGEIPSAVVTPTAWSRYSGLDAMALAELVRSKQASPADLLEDAISKIEALNPAINAVIHKTYDRARARLSLTPASGAFAGVPWLLKDISDCAGVPMSLGSRALRNAVSQVDVPFIAAAEASGLNIVGVTNVPEFGLTDSSENLLFGRTRNPWNLAYSAGGSAGGAAAAVAAGILPMAHGNDGGGSLRIPASHCGLFALKPSRGRHLPAHVQGLPFDIACDGVISRSVRDSAMFLSIVEDPATRLAHLGYVGGKSPRRLKIGLLLDLGNGIEPDADVLRAVHNTARLCVDLGHSVTQVTLPFNYNAFMDAFMTIWMAGASLEVTGVASAVGIGESDYAGAFDPWTLALHGEAQSLGGAPALLQSVAPLIINTAAQTDTFLQQWDVVLSPVCQGTVIKLGQRDINASTSYSMLKQRLRDYVAYTPIHNVCGTPAMSVPLQWDANGLPVGSQFCARVGGEASLLGLAYELEEAMPWANRYPTFQP